MKRFLAALAGLILVQTVATADTGFFPAIDSYVATSLEQVDEIPADRKRQLKKIALYIQTRVKSDLPVNLTYICTHNSRRSHMSQLWAQTAAEYYGVPAVKTFSGGTEATAFNPRAVAALKRAGFQIEQGPEVSNPIYQVRSGQAKEPMTAFSKKYMHESNPQSDYCAVMTCSDADKNCPTVEGASFRVAIPYEDPKAFDGTEREAAAYDERCRQISREMLWLFSQVNV
ncbi:MAG: protein-tyrosine-phosphatase [Pseudomonadota bacterium]